MMDCKQNYCSECSHELTLLKGTYDFYGYCPECFIYEGPIRERGTCCSKPNIHYVRHTIRDGRFQLRQQCKHCGSNIGTSLPYKTVKDIHSLAHFDYDLSYLVEKLRREENGTKSKFVLKKFKEKTGITTDVTFRPFTYMEYIESPLWQEKRKLVLKRDNFLCQSCLTRKAIQVHHLTYKHLANEPLFDLVSVCYNCHKAITDMDNDCESKKIIHLEMLKRVFNRNQAS